MLRRTPSCPPQLQTHHLKSNALVAVPGRLWRNESINMSESEREGGEEGNHTAVGSQSMFFIFGRMHCLAHFADVNLGKWMRDAEGELRRRRMMEEFQATETTELWKSLD